MPIQLQHLYSALEINIEDKSTRRKLETKQESNEALQEFEEKINTPDNFREKLTAQVFIYCIRDTEVRKVIRIAS